MPRGTPSKSKTCPICQEEFVPKVPSQRYCEKDHYQPCPICSSPVLWNSTRAVPCCSKECSKIQRRRNNLAKYGVEHPMQLNSVKDKQRSTMKERYGVEYSTQSDEIKGKIINSNLSKFGTEWGLSNKDVREKIKETNLDKYGVENPFQAEEVKDKIRKTNLDKYGTENPMQSPEVQSKAKETDLKKYGVPYHIQSKAVKDKARKTRKEHQSEITEKTRDTFKQRYGYDSCFKSPEVNEKRIKTLLEHYGVEVPIYSEEIKQKIIDTNMRRYGSPWYVMTEEYTKNFNTISKTNLKFLQFLQDYNIDISESDMEFHIENRSFDFHIPDSNILIEINPTYTHNSFHNHFSENGLDSNYHKLKSQLAEDNGYRCIHIWEWDDWNKIVELILLKERLYARKCVISKLEKKDADEFLEKYHLQSTCKGNDVNIGLVHNNELIGVMTFGKPRYNKNYQWELLRLCFKPHISVVGGSEKMFSHFLNEYNPTSIISYCDASKFSGTVYEKLGFKLERTNSPAKHWYLKNSEFPNHITTSYLLQRGFDQIFKTNYGKGTDNELLMLSYGYLPVYDCGQKVFTYEY